MLFFQCAIFPLHRTSTDKMTCTLLSYSISIPTYWPTLFQSSSDKSCAVVTAAFTSVLSNCEKTFNILWPHIRENICSADLLKPLETKMYQSVSKPHLDPRPLLWINLECQEANLLEYAAVHHDHTGHHQQQRNLLQLLLWCCWITGLIPSTASGFKGYRFLADMMTLV